MLALDNVVADADTVDDDDVVDSEGIMNVLCSLHTNYSTTELNLPQTKKGQKNMKEKSRWQISLFDSFSMKVRGSNCWF